MSLNLTQLESRLRDTKYNIPGIGIVDLWDIQAKEIMPKVKLRNLINAAIVEWAIENEVEKDAWDLTGGLTVNEGRYAMPIDLFIMTEAWVNYDDSKGILGSRVIQVDQPFLIDEDAKQPETGLPERIFIWGDQYELRPIPDSAYTFRMFGYRKPGSLVNDSSTLDTYEYAEESVYLKCRELVARELRDAGKMDIIADYERVRNALKRFDDERHDAVRIVKGGSGYW